MTTLLEPQNDFIASIYDEMARQMGDSRDSILQANETAAEIEDARQPTGGIQVQRQRAKDITCAFGQDQDQRADADGDARDADQVRLARAEVAPGEERLVHALPSTLPRSPRRLRRRRT